MTYGGSNGILNVIFFEEILVLQRTFEKTLLWMVVAGTPVLVHAESPCRRVSIQTLGQEPFLFSDGSGTAYDPATQVLYRKGGSPISCSDDSIADRIRLARETAVKGPNQVLFELGPGVGLVPGAAYQAGDDWYYGIDVAAVINGEIGRREPLLGSCALKWRQPAPTPPASGGVNPAPKFSHFTLSPTSEIGFTLWNSQKKASNYSECVSVYTEGPPSNQNGNKDTFGNVIGDSTGSTSATSPTGGTVINGGGYVESQYFQDRCTAGGFWCNGYIYDGNNWHWDGASVRGSIPRKEPEATTTLPDAE